MTRDRQRSAPETLLAAIMETVPQRVTPRCRHFGTCGGCQMQHLAEPAQVAAKTAMLVQVLQQAGLHSVPTPLVHTAEPWQYRNRARMRVEDGNVGYSKRASNEFLPIQECPIVSPLIWRTAVALHSITADRQARWPRGTKSFELFANSDESALQLSLQVGGTVASVDRDAPRDLRSLCDALAMQVPELAGAGLLVSANPDPKQSRRVQESARVEIARWGEASLLYRVAGTDYRVTRNSFFQVNRLLTATMRQLVVGERSGSLAYDLFAGSGLFSVPLTQHFDRVVAVEIGEPAASDLAVHLLACGPHHRAVRSTALAFLQRPGSSEQADLIVLDPPRAGLGPQATRALAKAGPKEIVYVSCDAGTFAADSRTLVESGYKLETLHLLDLFPQTVHTETIASFRR